MTYLDIYNSALDFMTSNITAPILSSNMAGGTLVFDSQPIDIETERFETERMNSVRFKNRRIVEERKKSVYDDDGTDGYNENDFNGGDISDSVHDDDIGYSDEEELSPEEMEMITEYLSEKEKEEYASDIDKDVLYKPLEEPVVLSGGRNAEVIVANLQEEEYLNNIKGNSSLTGGYVVQKVTKSLNCYPYVL